MNTELQDADSAGTPTPIHIEAEDYIRQSGGITTETCTDTGGGQNLTGINNTSWAEYSVNVPVAGTYLVKFRVAGSAGTFQFKDSSLNVLATVNVPNTGGMQTWTTVTATVVLPAGTQKLHFYVTWYGWNINWFELVLRGANGSSNSSGVGGYRYGFNGQEKTDEIKGAGNSYTAEFWEYDPRLGRRWNLDPKPSVGLSEYSTFRNSPISHTDVRGDTTYHSTRDGKFIDADNTGRGVWIATGEYKTYNFKVNVGSQKKPKYENRSVTNFQIENLYMVNDPNTDVKQLANMKAGDKLITFVSEANIKWIMNKSDIHHRGIIGRNDFAYSESVGGKMDFNYKYTLPSQGINPTSDDSWIYDNIGGFMVMGDPNKEVVAYNLNDAGQWLWGQAMMQLGFGLGTAQQGANLQSRGAGHGPDTKADQNAIGMGFIYKIDPALRYMMQGDFKEPQFDKSPRDDTKILRKTDRVILRF